MEKTMKRTVAILLSTILVAGCPDGRFIKPGVKNNCGGTGWTLTAIHYGDSRIFVIPLSEVVADAEFRFVLLPQRKGRGASDFSNAVVKVRGKRDPQDDWFQEISGTANDVSIYTCVDSSLKRGDTVEYDVEVMFVGEPKPRATLDPRAIVIDR